MLLLRLWNYIRGYVIIVVEGYFLEKFINICTHRQILLWDVKRQKDCVMTLKVSIKGFKLLRPVAKKAGCRVKIRQKKGLPFFLNRYRKRKTFFIGAVVFIALIYCMTSFIWDVEITGNNRVDASLIKEKLAEHGIHPGVMKFGINSDKIVNDIMLDINDLAWVSVSVKGTKVKVQVVERVKPMPVVPKNQPCDLIAYRDGVITSIEALIGTKNVKVGDTIKKGQVLVSGTITSTNTKVPAKLVHAMGTIKARTWYEKTCPVNTIIKQKVRTGKTKSRFSLSLFTKSFGLNGGKIKNDAYESEEHKRFLSLGKDMVLPFGIITSKYYETETIEKTLSLEDAKKLAADNAYKEAAADIPEDAKITNTIIQFKVDENSTGDDGLVADVIIECSEDIGIMTAIGG